MYEMNRNFAVGSDISWYPQMLASGFTFRNKHGAEQDLLTTLKEYNHNAVRLRTWVNPTDDPRSGHCSAAETAEIAKQCYEQGFRIMLNFHYGDTWCDPGKQVKPKAWADLAFDDLVNALYEYTYNTVKLLVDGGTFPEWVQIGNETNPGMLLPDGSAKNFAKLARLYNAGHDAVKAASPRSKTMIHLAEFNDTDFIVNYFDNLTANNCRFDMTAFSFYPYWLAHYHNMTYEQAMENFNRSMRIIPERYPFEFMIAEIGALDEDERGSHQTLADVIESIHGQPLCTGLFYWEPQGARVWSKYALSAWRGDGTPSNALEAFNLIK
jgi:arabinogalactan endo-1,4-beta-galactosidase